MFLKIFIIFQVVNVIKMSNHKIENNVAFLCDRPSMVYKNLKWISDFQQNCIKDELGIVSYCQRSFPNENITSAEPGIEKIKFPEWCDFEGKNCVKNVEVRPFKCLKAGFQSDALTLPKDCLFAHLGGKDVCKLYKEWVVDAKEQCRKKPNWKLKSYGMLFQCGKVQEIVSPMYFRGVEFVCCPITEEPNDNVESEKLYKSYLTNAVLESEKGEESVYKSALQRLLQSEKETKNDLITDFKNGEKDLMKLWMSDPKLARTKENSLIEQFKTAFNAAIDQYTANKEQLLIFHDDRLKFIYKTRLDAAMKPMLDLLNKNDKNEMAILEAMKNVLNLLMIRKREILNERFRDRDLGSHMIEKLNKELKVVEDKITQLFGKLDKIPLFKANIKQKLLLFLTEKFPRISREESNELPEKIEEINEIISKYRHKSDQGQNDEFQVHYDLGLRGKDRFDHYSKNGRKFIIDRDTMVKHFDDKRLLFTLIVGTVVTAIIILLVGSMLILYRHRSSVFRYKKPKYQDQHCKQTLPAFGVNLVDSAKGVSATIPFNVYENPTYKVIQTTLKTEPDIGNNSGSEFVDTNPSARLIES